MTTRALGEPESFSYRALVADSRMVAVMLVVFVVMFGYEIPAPILSSIAEGVGVSDARIGLVMAAFAIPGVLFIPITGLIADLYGRRTVLVPSLVGFAVTGTLIGFVDSFTVILALRVLQGVTFAGILPISVVILGDLYKGAEGSASQGFRASAAGAATIVIPPLAGFLAGYGWQIPFLLHGVVFLVAAYVFFVIPEAGTGIEAGPRITDTLVSYATGVKAEVTDRQLAVLVSGGFVRGFARLAILTFVPLFAIRVLDASLIQAGFILSVRGIARLVLPPLSGIITYRYSRRLGLVIALIISGVSVALIPFTSTISMVAVLVFGFTVGDSFISPLLKDAVATHATDAHRAGVVNSFYVFQNTGEAISPAFFGLVLAVAGFEFVFILAAVVLAAYAIMVGAILIG